MNDNLDLKRELTRCLAHEKHWADIVERSSKTFDRRSKKFNKISRNKLASVRSRIRVLCYKLATIMINRAN